MAVNQCLFNSCQRTKNKLSLAYHIPFKNVYHSAYSGLILYTLSWISHNSKQGPWCFPSSEWRSQFQMCNVFAFRTISTLNDRCSLLRSFSFIFYTRGLVRQIYSNDVKFIHYKCEPHNVDKIILLPGHTWTCHLLDDDIKTNSRPARVMMLKKGPCTTANNMVNSEWRSADRFLGWIQKRIDVNYYETSDQIKYVNHDKQSSSNSFTVTNWTWLRVTSNNTIAVTTELLPPQCRLC